MIGKLRMGNIWRGIKEMREGEEVGKLDLLLQPSEGSLKLEGRAGIEPANTGFADPRVSHFATGPLPTNSTLHEAAIASIDIAITSKIQAQNRKPTSQFRFWR